jgi:hypothetical protein
MKAESRYEFCLFMNPLLHHHHLFFIFIFNNITDYTAEILGNLYNTTDQKFEVMGIMYLKNYRYSFTMKVTFFFFHYTFFYGISQLSRTLTEII